MKERLSFVLRVIRKFGFIMSAVMLFPYLSAIQSVQAFDDSIGFEDANGNTVSLQDLEEDYAEVQAALLEEQEIEDELGQYMIKNPDGTVDLVIPSGVNLSVTSAQVEGVRKHLEVINEMVEQDDAYVTSDFDVIVPEVYEDFVLQGNKTDFAVRWTHVLWWISDHDIDDAAIYMGVTAIGAVLGSKFGHFIPYVGTAIAIICKYFQTDLIVAAGYLGVYALLNKACKLTYYYWKTKSISNSKIRAGFTAVAALQGKDDKNIVDVALALLTTSKTRVLVSPQ